MRYYTDKEKHDANFLQVVIKDYCKKEGMGPFYFRVYPSAAAQKDHPEIYTENVGQGLKPSDNCYSQISVKSKPEDILQ
jgi:hypothetical protein